MPRASNSKNRGEKFYAVKVGRTPGVYHKWDEAEAQVSLLADERPRQVNELLR